MKKHWKIYCLCFLSICFISACQKHEPKEEHDFWKETIQVLEEATKANSYDADVWEIGIQDASVVSDEDHRSVHVTWKALNNEQEAFSFALENYGTKGIVYAYETTQESDTKTIQDRITVRSNDASYQRYQASYSRNVYQDGACIDTKTQEANIQIKDQHVEYENIPYLKEVMEKGDQFLSAFQKEFKISYAENGFVNLPLMMKDMKLVSMVDELKTSAGYTSYYSLAQINAKGHSLITALDIRQDFSSLIYQVYDIEAQSYETRNMELKTTDIENMYHMIPDYDADVLYTVYIDGKTAYMYSQKQEEQDIYDDILHGAKNALIVLNTDNPSAESYQTPY